MRLRSQFPLCLAAFGLLAGTAMAADHEAGVPLSPAEAGGGWTVESQGHAVCSVRLSPAKTGGVYGASSQGDCGQLIPSGVAGWTPTRTGMALTDASGQVLLSFDRWSNSLFVAKLSSGDDVQLQRGGPNPTPGSSSAGQVAGPRPYD